MNHALVLPSVVRAPRADFGPDCVLRDVVSGTRLAVLGMAAGPETVPSAKSWRRMLLAHVVQQPGPLLLGMGLALVVGTGPDRLRPPRTLLGRTFEQVVSLGGGALGIALIAAGSLILVLRHPRLLFAL
jgi:hypothetical protein